MVGDVATLIEQNPSATIAALAGMASVGFQVWVKWQADRIAKLEKRNEADSAKLATEQETGLDRRLSLLRAQIELEMRQAVDAANERNSERFSRVQALVDLSDRVEMLAREVATAQVAIAGLTAEVKSLRRTR